MNYLLFSFQNEPPPPKRSKGEKRQKGDVDMNISITDQVVKNHSDLYREKSILRVENKETDLVEMENGGPTFNWKMENSKWNPWKSILTEQNEIEPISTAIVTTIQETQDSPFSITSSIKSPIFETAIDRNEPNTPISLQNKQPAKKIVESPTHSITSSIKSQKLLDDDEDDEPPVEIPPKNAHPDTPRPKELPLERPTPTLSPFKPNKGPSGAKSPQMTPEKESSLPEPVIDENVSNEAKNPVEKPALNRDDNQKRIIDDIKLTEMSPKVKITPFAKHQHLVSKNDEDISDEPLSAHESTVESAISVEKPLFRTPNGRSDQVISGLVLLLIMNF